MAVEQVAWWCVEYFEILQIFCLQLMGFIYWLWRRRRTAKWMVGCKKLLFTVAGSKLGCQEQHCSCGLKIDPWITIPISQQYLSISSIFAIKRCNDDDLLIRFWWSFGTAKSERIKMSSGTLLILFLWNIPLYIILLINQLGGYH